MKRKVSVQLTTIQVDVGEGALFEQMEREYANVDFGEGDKEGPDRFEMISQGTLHIKDGQLAVEYDETELTGMQGATTRLSFALDHPETVTMLRWGAVTTALTFVKNARHISTYDTGVMPFELCVYTMELKNGLTADGGTLELEYIVEIRGAHAERNHLLFVVQPVEE